MKGELEFDYSFIFSVPTFIFRWIIVDFKTRRIINVGVDCFLLSPSEASYRGAFKINVTRETHFRIYFWGEVVLIKKKLKKNLMEKAFKTNFVSVLTFLWIPGESEIHHDNK